MGVGEQTAANEGRRYRFGRWKQRKHWWVTVQCGKAEGLLPVERFGVRSRPTAGNRRVGLQTGALVEAAWKGAVGRHTPGPAGDWDAHWGIHISTLESVESRHGVQT